MEKKIEISEEAYLQLIESINSAEGRICNGAEIEEGFNWLREELEAIKTGIAVNDTSLTK